MYTLASSGTLSALSSDFVATSPVIWGYLPSRLAEISGKSLRAWTAWNALEKNVWLWAETNTLIFDGLEKIDERRWLLVRFERFVSDPLQEYTRIRNFLGFERELAEETKEVLLSQVVNASRTHSIPVYEDWSAQQKAHFARYAGPVMKRLDYSYE